MIINFSIKNFGCIKSQQTLSFEAEKTEHLENFYITKVGKYRLLKLALIYGANASGKSTILKALDLIRTLVLKPLEKKTDELNFEPFLFDANTPKENTTFSIEFLQNNIKYYYEVEFNNKAIVREILNAYDPHKYNVYTRTTNLKHQVSEIIFSKKIKIGKPELKALEFNTLWNNTVLGGYLKTNIENHELKEVSDWFKHYLYPIILSKTNLHSYIISLINNKRIKKEDIVTILKKADLNISDIIIKKQETELKEFGDIFMETVNILPELFTLYELSHATKGVEVLKKLETITTSNELKLVHSVNGKKYDLSFNLESEGTKRYFGLAGLLNILIKNSAVIPIDELESSLHPDLYQHFLLTFLANAQQSQIIATTHNREILGDKDLIRDDAIWITDKSEDNSTELYSLADFHSSVIRDTTNRLNVYKSGKLGGIPNVSDYYLELK